MPHIDYRAYKEPLGLVLTRKLGDQIILEKGNDKIILTHVATKGSTTRIAINAPGDWIITRVECPPAAVKPS